MANNPPNMPPHTFSLKGRVPSGIAAVALLAQADARWVLLIVDKPGLQGRVLTNGQRVVHAEVRSAELNVALDWPGRLLWKGREALLALALLAKDAVEVELRAVAEPDPGQVPNCDASLTMALLDQAVAVDTGMSLSALPCVVELLNKAA